MTDILRVLSVFLFLASIVAAFISGYGPCLLYTSALVGIGSWVSASRDVARRNRDSSRANVVSPSRGTQPSPRNGKLED